MELRHGATVVSEHRTALRDEVYHRTRATGPDGAPLTLLVVNISAGGLMARCEQDCRPTDRLTVQLPVIGAIDAEVRWALGGRIGCQLDRVIPLADYYAVLAAMARG